MSDTNGSGPNDVDAPDAVVDALERGDRSHLPTALRRLAERPDATGRKEALRAVRGAAEDRPDAVAPAVEALAPFLVADDRAVRLTVAKLFAALAERRPTAVLSVASTLADRLADDGEFYYVRARCAEALGYVATEEPEEVATPELLADLRVGLAFDEPEVRRKLAKALAAVATGDPERLAHQVESLAEHLDDGEPLVRYHLCTALVVVGCERPSRLSTAADALAARLHDEEPHVRGRAAEALGLLARVDENEDPSDSVLPAGVDLRAALADAVENADADGDAAAFLRTRVRFAEAALDDAGEANDGRRVDDGVASVAAIREHTDAVVEAMMRPEEGACPHCDAPLPDGDLPMCPHCGAPR